MSEHHFGLGRGKVSDRTSRLADKIARRHGASFVTYQDPAQGPRYWFAGPNEGHPFDSQRARAVAEELRAAGLDIERLGRTS